MTAASGKTLAAAPRQWTSNYVDVTAASGKTLDAPATAVARVAQRRGRRKWQRLRQRVGRAAQPRALLGAVWHHAPEAGEVFWKAWAALTHSAPGAVRPRLNFGGNIGANTRSQRVALCRL